MEQAMMPSNRARNDRASDAQSRSKTLKKISEDRKARYRLARCLIVPLRNKSEPDQTTRRGRKVKPISGQRFAAAPKGNAPMGDVSAEMIHRAKSPALFTCPARPGPKFAPVIMRTRGTALALRNAARVTLIVIGVSPLLSSRASAFTRIHAGYSTAGHRSGGWPANRI